MIQIKVDGLDDLKAFVEQDFEGRVLAMQKYLLRTIVEDVYLAVQKGIPDTELWLQAYKKSLKVYEIEDMPDGEFGYAIASRVSGDWSMVDGSKMVIKFEAYPGLDNSVGAIMQQFSPFSVDQVPDIEDYGAKVVIRRVREKEVEEVREINEKNRAELVNKLNDAGMTVGIEHPEIKGKIYFDLQFAVVRMELALGEIRKPHWKPALRKVGVFLSQAAMANDVHKVMAKYFDPNEVDWKQENRKSHEVMRLRDVDGFEEFQKRVYPRVL